MEGDFRIDQWLVQPQLNTVVSPENTTVQLEPKVMEVLAFLAGHADEVLPKERILQAVWPDTFVTEDVLMHAISEIRKAFGDDARDPRYIQTILKRGYRLIAPVTALRQAALRYEVIEKLGEGGMAEVFLARDVELQRKVALKFIRAGEAEEESGRKRLLREARAAAALDHPFIAKIFDTGRMDGRTFIAMEHIEGRTLKQKLAKGRLEIKEALRIAMEIAEALEAAHDRGIVHRDLKPSNIMITPQGHVKVMDFGLAKRLPQADQSASLEETVSALTKEGTTAGTLPYMSPEQLRAEAVDHRSDIFSFGIVLHEMLTGRHPFRTEILSHTAAAILHKEAPPLFERLGQTHVLLQHTLDRMLAKSPERRYHHVHEVRTELSDCLGEIAGVGPKKISPRLLARYIFPAVLASIVLAAAVAAVVIWRLRDIAPAPSLVAELGLAPANRLGTPVGLETLVGLHRPALTAFALSPDGSYLVFTGTGGSGTHLYLRHLDRLDARLISGTEGAACPFVSPDGRWVGFWSDGKLKRVDPLEGSPAEICDIRPLMNNFRLPPFGASWGEGDVIAFSPWFNKGLYRVSASGGIPEMLTKLDAGKGEIHHRLPHFLPDGRTMLFTSMAAEYNWNESTIVALDLKTGTQKDLVSNGADARYAAPGRILFAREGQLLAAPFSLGKMEITGLAVPVVRDLMQAIDTGNGFINSGAGQFSFSSTGTLVYAPGGRLPPWMMDLVWVDFSGNERLLCSPSSGAVYPRVSPDGQRVAYRGLDQVASVWIYDITRGTNMRLTTHGEAGVLADWHPRLERLTFAWAKRGRKEVCWQAADGSSPVEQLVNDGTGAAPGEWSPDGEILVFVRDGDIWIFRLKNRQAQPLIQSPFVEWCPTISPDGRWLAYGSNESGRAEIYVCPFPAGGAKWPISTGGGSEPLWAPSGRELYFRSGTGEQFWAAAISSEAAFRAGKPRMLFETKGYRYPNTTAVRNYDISPDGRHFLATLIKERAPQPVSELIVVQNWFGELKRLCPAGK